MEARSRFVALRDLSYHLVEWSPPEGAAASGLTVVLLHGFADAGGSWVEVAPALARAGHRVVAPDLRGFGETSWVGAGGYYHFADYVADVDALVDQLSPGRLALVGHSMGGHVATLYAGARPERVSRLAVLEGLGPPDHGWAEVPDRYVRWLDAMRDGGRPAPRPMPREQALARLAAQHPGVSPEALERRLGYLAREHDDGRLVWRFDPLHRTTSPVPFFVESFRAFARRVRCPVLVVTGGEAGYRPPDEAERVACFHQATARDLEGAGHMIHWTRPAELSALLVEFLA